MASSITLPNLQRSVPRSHFLGQTKLPHSNQRLGFSLFKQLSNSHLRPTAKLDLAQIMGGRGLCNGEKGIEQELKRKTEHGTSSSKNAIEDKGDLAKSMIQVPENGFGKELLGLTGGFPGGEKGLQKFIEQNPPPIQKQTTEEEVSLVSKKPKPPQLPLLMPGMIAIVKNTNNPFYMYCGIVQRITDGKAGVLFEGGNWDRLITFRLDELERREKGPPMKNPKSAILESLIQQDSQ